MRPRGCPRSPGPAGDSTRRARPAPRRARAVLGVGSSRSSRWAPCGRPRRCTRRPARRRVSSSSCVSSWDRRDGRRGRPGGGGGAGWRAPPRACAHPVPIPGPRLCAPRARCFRSPSRLLIPAARYHPISPFLAPNAPAARCHRLLTPQIPHFYPLSQSRRTHYSCEPTSPQTKSSPPAWPSLGCTGMHLSEAPYHRPCLSFGHDPRNPLCCPLQPSVPGLRIIKTAT